MIAAKSMINMTGRTMIAIGSAMIKNITARMQIHIIQNIACNTDILHHALFHFILLFINFCHIDIEKIKILFVTFLVNTNMTHIAQSN